MLDEVKDFRFGLVAALLSSLLVLAPLGSSAAAGAGDEQVCDVAADYYLGTEQYNDAIRLHRQIVASNPANALAHYHLGYAEGAEENAAAEIDEYQRAVKLGLRNWDLFLNLGLGELGQGDLDGATENLRKAVYFGETHPESHFNLALVYERREMLTDAEREALASLRLRPTQSGARDLLRVIYAQEGKTDLPVESSNSPSREQPDDMPARLKPEQTAAVNQPPVAAAVAASSTFAR
jgi:tetratricopeptide (TPR) repeat protein